MNDLLTRQKDTESSLDLLITLYGKILTGENETVGLNIDTIRHDITECLQNFISINDSLIAYDGILRSQMDKLQNAKLQIDKLAGAQDVLEQQLSNLNKFSSKHTLNNSESTKDKTDLTTILQESIAENKYKSTLNRYLLLKDKHDSQDIPMSIESINESISLLNDADSNISKEIKLLQSFLNQLLDDQKLITTELRNNKQLINSERDKLLGQLNAINKRLIDILNNIGLPIPQTKSISIKDFLSNLSWSMDNNIKNSMNNIITENNHMIQHSTEFINLQLQSLKEQLTIKKSNTSTLINDKSFWSDCVSNIQNFEQNLQNIIINQNINTTNPDIIDLIRNEIFYLSKQLNLTDNIKLKTLVQTDIKVLNLAIKELSNTQDTIPTTANNNTANNNTANTNTANRFRFGSSQQDYTGKINNSNNNNNPNRKME